MSSASAARATRDWSGPAPDGWENRDWRNVPGPFCTAGTDNRFTGRQCAPEHVAYEDEHCTEFVYRQPVEVAGVHELTCTGECDPFGAYGGDGDRHWTRELVRDSYLAHLDHGLGEYLRDYMFWLSEGRPAARPHLVSACRSSTCSYRSAGRTEPGIPTRLKPWAGNRQPGRIKHPDSTYQIHANRTHSIQMSNPLTTER